MAQTRRHGHPRRRFAHRGTPQKGRIRNAGPAGRAQTRRIQRRGSRHHLHDARGAERDRTRQQGDRQVQEHVRTGHLLLAVRPSGGLRPEIPRRQVRQEESRRGRGQQAGHRGRLQLRRQHPSVRQQLHRGPGSPREGHLPVDQRQRRHGVGPVRRRREGRACRSSAVRTRSPRRR